MSAPTSKVVFLEGAEDVDVDSEYRQLVEEATIEECAIQLPRGYISVSQVNTYRRCPRQYYFRYIKDLIRAPSASQLEGSAVHQSVAAGHLAALKNGSAPMDLMLDVYQDYWKRNKNDINWKAEEDVVNEDLIVRRDHQFLTLYNNYFIPKLTPRVDATGAFVERRFWVTVGSQRIPLLGYIDLVAKNDTVFSDAKVPDGSGEEEVIDHKVVKQMKPQSDVDSDLQLTVYARVTGVSHVRFQCFVKNKIPKIKAVASQRNFLAWPWAEFVISEVAGCIAAGKFPPGADGWHCTPRFCGYYDDCHSSLVSS